MPDKLRKLFGWLDFGGSMLGTVANVISTALTNKSNQRIAAAQNAMQIAENEKAYQRSKATNQVNLMRDAGMSKAGALNALNGGGSYQPAPITSTPNQAPQIDMSSAFDGLIQIGENAKQRKMQEEALDKQIAAAKEQQQKQFEENARQREHDLEMQSRDHNNTNRNADNRLNFDKSVHDYFKEDERKEIRARVANLQSSKKLTDEQRKQLSDLYELTRENAVQAIELVKAQVSKINKDTDLDYKKYLLDKAKTILEAKLGNISYLRNTIDFWKQPEHMSLIAKGVGWETDYSKRANDAEEDLEKYLDELQTLIDLLE